MILCTVINVQMIRIKRTCTHTAGTADIESQAKMHLHCAQTIFHHNVVHMHCVRCICYASSRLLAPRSESMNENQVRAQERIETKIFSRLLVTFCDYEQWTHLFCASHHNFHISRASGLLRLNHKLLFGWRGRLLLRSQSMIFSLASISSIGKCCTFGSLSIIPMYMYYIYV